MVIVKIHTPSSGSQRPEMNTRTRQNWDFRGGLAVGGDKCERAGRQEILLQPSAALLMFQLCLGVYLVILTRPREGERSATLF